MSVACMACDTLKEMIPFGELVCFYPFCLPILYIMSFYTISSSIVAVITYSSTPRNGLRIGLAGFLMTATKKVMGVNSLVGIEAVLSDVCMSSPSRAVLVRALVSFHCPKRQFG